MDVVELLANSAAIIAPASGLTGGGMLALFLWLIKNEKLWFGKQHDAIVAEKDKQLAQEKASHEREMAAAAESHEREMKTVLAELDRTREDRDVYSAAETLQRERADKIQDRTMETVVPVLAGVNHALGQIAHLAGEPEAS